MAPQTSSPDTQIQQSNDVTVESLIEDVSIDGMCGVY